MHTNTHAHTTMYTHKRLRTRMPHTLSYKRTHVLMHTNTCTHTHPPHEQHHPRCVVFSWVPLSPASSNWNITKRRSIFLELIEAKSNCYNPTTLESYFSPPQSCIVRMHLSTKMARKDFLSPKVAPSGFSLTNITPSGLYSPKSCTVRIYFSGKLYCQNICLNKVAPTGVISPKSCTVRNGSRKVLSLGWWFKKDAPSWFTPLSSCAVSSYFPTKLHHQQFKFFSPQTCTIRFCFQKKLHRQSFFTRKVAPSGFFFTTWILHRQDFLLHKVAPSGVEADAIFFLIGAAKETFMSVHLFSKKNLTVCLRWKITTWQCINLGVKSRWCIFCEEKPDGASLLEN